MPPSITQNQLSEYESQTHNKINKFHRRDGEWRTDQTKCSMKITKTLSNISVYRIILIACSRSPNKNFKQSSCYAVSMYLKSNTIYIGHMHTNGPQIVILFIFRAKYIEIDYNHENGIRNNHFVCAHQFSFWNSPFFFIAFLNTFHLYTSALLCMLLLIRQTLYVSFRFPFKF